MTHEEIWNGIVNLAKRLNLTCSGLARMAGLDPTVFNKSKRINRNGVPRWPSTYSLARVLNVAKIDLAEFANLMKQDKNSQKEKNK
ncbi:MAG: helix-turn-helix transcriptional regulator [Alphaproteobacteria bacterium]|nr:helix-turn-helix transcriptional regulator [Alphaproteobacteria bacterium]